MKDKKFNTFDRNDDFWNIDEMLPKKRFGAAFSSDTDTVEIKINSQKEQHGQAIPRPSEEDRRRIVSKAFGTADEVIEVSENNTSRYTAPSERIRIARDALKKAEEKHMRYAAVAFGNRTVEGTTENEASVPAEEPLFTYLPQNNPLIKEITVKLWPARYSFYEQFRRDAVKYFDKTSTPCPAAPFFSFTPQYSQLSREQLSFYLYFRTCVRERKKIKADHSYILLLIYEIINLPDILPPEEGIELLLFIWQSYRTEYPKLDRHLSEWVCDYCLIHRLEPANIDANIVNQVSSSCSLKEFYVGLDASSSSPYASALFAYASVYNYRNSKFITDENRYLFDKHIKEAFIYAFSKAEHEGKTIFAPIGEKSMIPLKTVRDAYNGALCAYNVKRRIEVSYLSCSRSADLRYAVTDTVKFAENQVRALLGIRSRFHTPNLALPLKNAVEEYFEPLKKTRRKENEKPSVPEYDILYEPKVSELSLSFAKDIEQRSWMTTELLTDGIDEFYDDEGNNTPNSEKTSSAVSTSEGENLLKEALSLCINGDQSGFSSLAHQKGLLPDALCEAVNDRMCDIIGDAAIECADGDYRIVVDYMEEITEWMKK